MSFSEQYEGYKWIKVKKYIVNEALSHEERYQELEKHHIEETSFLINEIRNLAKLADNIALNGDFFKRCNQVSVTR